jgi:hypothetical protein
MSDLHCLGYVEYDLGSLGADHPPFWRHPLKQQVYDFVRANAESPTGSVRCTRWEVARMPETLPSRCPKVEVEADVYSYSSSGPGVWHVNFADPDLFVAYGSALLAQDELQVLEHPVLGSLREALLTSGHPARTRENGRSTPILVAGVPRQCALDIFPDPDQGRPRGLYGNQFQQASWDSIRSALTILRPATITNLICIAAPTGSGRYTAAQVENALETAYTGMKAAQVESRLKMETESVEVHTGFWGCGAFGGNRPLMTLIQLLAAQLAGIDKLVFYTGTQSEVITFENGQSILRRLLEKLALEPSLPRVREAIMDHHFSWGTSDGN